MRALSESWQRHSLQWLTPMSHTHGRTGVPLLALLIASCQISPTSPPPPMVRLGGAGEARSLRFEDETRPVLDLTSGEARVFRVDVEPGSQMVFAVAILENAPAAGFVHLRLTVEGREVFTDRFSVRRRGHWFHRAITLEDSGPVEIGFRAHHGKARGGAFPDTGTDGEPFIAISMPRVYRAAADERERRVFVWISQDALRADHLGSYGYSRATSPHFDARAESWTVFESATASASWTLPSMTSQFLSRHPSSHGAVLHNLLPEAGMVSVFQALADDGFTVIGVTANDLISPAYSLTRGFDVLLYRERKAAALRSRLTETLDEWKRGDLAIFVHFMDPHQPYVPPPAFRHRFHAEHDGPEPQTHFEALLKIQSPEGTAHVVALYDAEIAYADAVIERLLDDLQVRGLFERALIVYSADHGEQFRDHGGWLHGGTLYEEEIHVPLAIRVPGTRPGRVKTPVSLVDLAPTVLESLKVDIPPTFQGRSLLPLLTARGEVRGRSAISETILTGDRRPLLSHRDGSLKVILRLSPRHSDGIEIESGEFFDLDSDPSESNNLWGDPRGDVLASVATGYLTRARSTAGVPRFVFLSPEAIQKLQALGYLR